MQSGESGRELKTLTTNPGTIPLCTYREHRESSMQVTRIEIRVPAQGRGGAVRIETGAWVLVVVGVPMATIAQSSTSGNPITLSKLGELL